MTSNSKSEGRDFVYVARTMRHYAAIGRDGLMKAIRSENFPRKFKVIDAAAIVLKSPS
jgi:hypothetical protein